MSRSAILLLIVCSIFSLPIAAQELGAISAESSLRDNDSHSRHNPDALDPKPTNARISVRRLRVPRKAQELFKKALSEWSKHAPAESQRDLDRALKLEADFPDALALYGGIEATRDH